MATETNRFSLKNKKMRRILIAIASLLLLSSASVYVLKASGLTGKSKGEQFAEVTKQNSGINWVDFNTGLKMQSQSPRKMLIYVHTSWCSYCKKMENGTFSDPSLVAYINEKYIPVMLDAESKEVFKLKEYEFKYIANSGRGYNELAAALLDGKMGYPSTVFMTENMERITVYPGYQDASAYKSVLKFIAEDIYLTKSFADYSAGK